MMKNIVKFGAELMTVVLAFAGATAAMAETVTVTSQEELVAAVNAIPANGGGEIILNGSEFTLYKKGANTTGKSIAFIGQVDANGKPMTTWNYGGTAQAKGEGSSDYSFDGAGTISFKNVVFQDAIVDAGSLNYCRGFVRAANMAFENCKFGNMIGYWGTGNVSFKGCLFDVDSTYEYSLKLYSGDSFFFDGCTFMGNKKGYIQAYCEKKDAYNDVVVKDCVFIKKADGATKTAVYYYEYGASNAGSNWNMSFVGNNVSDVALWGDAKVATEHNSTITENGVKVWENGAKVASVELPESEKIVVADAVDAQVSVALVPEEGAAAVTPKQIESVKAVLENAAVVAASAPIAEKTTTSEVVAALKSAASSTNKDKVTDSSEISTFVNVSLAAAETKTVAEQTVVKAMTFEVKPIAMTVVEGEVVSAVIPNAAITKAIVFRLPVDANATETKADVFHNGDKMGTYDVATVNDAKYIEVASATFSTFSYTLKEGGEEPTYAAYIGTTGYETIQAAVDAADVQAGIVTIKVMAGTHNGGVDLKKSKLAFEEGGKTWYGRIKLVGEEGAIISGQIALGTPGPDINVADVTIEGFTFVDTEYPIYIDNNSAENGNGNTKNVTIKDNTFNYSGNGPYVISAVVDGLTVTGNNFNCKAGNKATLGGAECAINNVTISGNTFEDWFGIYGQVLEGGVIVSGNTFKSSHNGYCIWINNNKAENVGKITISDNDFANTITYPVGFSAKYGKKSDIVIGADNAHNGEAITGWAEVADHEVLISSSADEALAQYFNHKLYLGDETAFETLDEAVEADVTGDPLTIVNYNSEMTAPTGWEFKTDSSTGITTLVKKAAAVAEIFVGDESKGKYETLAAAVAAVEDGQTIKLLTNLGTGSETFYLGGCATTDNPSVTLDLGGFSIFGKVDGGGCAANTKYTMTIKNGTLDGYGVSGCVALHPSGSRNGLNSKIILEDVALFGRIDVAFADVEIKSGVYTISAEKAATVANFYDGYGGVFAYGPWYGSSATISGGKFDARYVEPREVMVPFENYLATGYTLDGPDADGFYTVVCGGSSFAAEIVGGEKYETVEAAFAAAKDGDTVKLLKDVGSITLEPAVAGRIWIDLGGRAVCSGIDDRIKVESDESVALTLVIKNGTIGTASGWSTVVQGSRISSIRLENVGLYGTMIGSNGCKIEVFSGEYHANELGDPVGDLLSQNVTFYGGVLDYNPDDTVAAQNCNCVVAPGYESVAIAGGKYEVRESALQPLVAGDDGFYHIGTVTDLRAFRSMVNGGDNFKGKTVVLDADLDLSGFPNWEPIGVAGDHSRTFAGTFDGQEKKIKNLDSGYGLFRSLGQGNESAATIKNLTIQNVTISGNNMPVGAICAGGNYTYGSAATFDNCHVIGNIAISGSMYVGGVCGSGCNTFRNCSVEGNEGSTISGDTYVGGLYGWSAEGSFAITQCSVSGVSINGVQAVGGIAGMIMGKNSITECSVEEVVISASNDEGAETTGLIAGMNYGTPGYASYAYNNAVTETTATATHGETTYPTTHLTGLTTDGLGSVVGTDVTFDENGKIVSGSFEQLVESQVADDSTVTKNDDGTWTVEAKTYAAYIGTTGYETLDAAIKAAAAMDQAEEKVIELQSCEITESIKLPATLKNVTFRGQEDGASVLKDMTINSSDGSAYTYENIWFDGVVFENSMVIVTGGRSGIEVNKNWKFTGNTFRNLTQQGYSYLHFASLSAEEPAENFTFTGNVVDGSTFASAAALNISSVTGNIDFKNNEIKNLLWRPMNIQINNHDGVADVLTVTGNKFGINGSAPQMLTKFADGSDSLTARINQNIFGGNIETGFILAIDNPQTLDGDVTHNYYSSETTRIWIPNKYVYFNNEEAADLPHADNTCFSYYTGLTEGGEIDPATLVEVKKAVAQIVETGKKYETLDAAIADVQDGQIIDILADSVELVFNGKHFTYRGRVDENGKPITVVTSRMTRNTGDEQLAIAGVAFTNINFQTELRSKSGFGLSYDGTTFGNCKFSGDCNALTDISFTYGGVLTIDNCEFVQDQQYALKFDTLKGSAFISNSKITGTVAISPNDETKLDEKIVFSNCYFAGWNAASKANINIYNNLTEFHDCLFAKKQTDASASARGILTLSESALVLFDNCTAEDSEKTVYDVFRRDYVEGVDAVNVVTDENGKFTDGVFISKSANIVAGYVAEGYTVNAHPTIPNGWTLVPPATEVAAVISADGTKTNKYETLQAAIAAANDGDTVKLLANVTLPAGQAGWIGKHDVNITIDGAKEDGGRWSITAAEGGPSNSNLFTCGGDEDTIFKVVNCVINYQNTSDNLGVIVYHVGGQNIWIENCEINAPHPLYNIVQYGGAVDGAKNTNSKLTFKNNVVNCQATSHLVGPNGGSVIVGNTFNDVGNARAASIVNRNGIASIRVEDNVFKNCTKSGLIAVNAGSDVTLSLKGNVYTECDTVFAAKGAKTTFTGDSEIVGVAKAIDVSSGATLKISGGMYAGSLTSIGTISLTGGIYSAEPVATYIAEGYEVVNNPDEETAATYPKKVQEKTVTTKDEKPIVIDITEKPVAGEPDVMVPITVTQELAAEILPGTDVTKPLTEEQVTQIVTQLEEKGDDGMTGWQKYTAGFSQTDKHPLAPKGKGGEDGQLVLVTSLVAPKQLSVDTGVKVKYILKKATKVNPTTGVPDDGDFTKVQELPTPEFPVDVTQLDPETYWKIDVEYTVTRTVEVPVGPEEGK